MQKDTWNFISKEIRKIMIDRDLTVSSLANELGLSRGHVNSVLSGYIRSKSTQQKLCTYFKIDFAA